MKAIKTVLILAVIALLTAGPAAASGKDVGHKEERYKYKHHEYKHHKDKGPEVSQALLLFTAGSNMDAALTKHYRKDPLYKEMDIHPYHQRGYVVGAGPFDLVIYNRGTHYGDETAYGVKLVVAINDLSLFDSAVINGVPLSKASFTQEPGTPRFDVGDEAFPDHGVFPAYYTEIEIGTIEKGTPIVVGVDVKGDPRDLLIHFDAYGQGTRYRCDDDCHGHDGKKGHGKKYDCDDKGKHHEDCCEKDRHGRHQDWENCTPEAFDISNKLSHDVTQVGGTSAMLSVVFGDGNPAEIQQGAAAPFIFDVVVAESQLPPLFSVTAEILDENRNQVAFLSSQDPNPASGPVFYFDGVNVRGSRLSENTVYLPGIAEFTYRLGAQPSQIEGLAPLGTYIFKVCAPAETDTGGPACGELKFEVVTGPL